VRSNGVEQRLSKSSRSLRVHVDGSLGQISNGDNSFMRNDLISLGKSGSRKVEGIDKVDCIVNGGNRLSVLERLVEEAKDSSDLRKRGHVTLASNDDDGIPHDALGVGESELSSSILGIGSISSNNSLVWANNERHSTSGLKHGSNGGKLLRLVSVADEESDLASLDGVLDGDILTENRRLVAVSRSLRLGRSINTNSKSDLLSKRSIDVIIKLDHALANSEVIAMRKLEDGGFSQMASLPIGQTVEEKSGLAVKLEELGTTSSNLRSMNHRWSVGVAVDLVQSRASKSVGSVVDSASVDRHSVEAISLVVGDRANRSVDRDFLEIRSSKSSDLSIEIREVSSLKKRIIAGLNSWNEVLGAESDLLGLGEVVADVAIENHLADTSNRD